MCLSCCRTTGCSAQSTCNRYYDDFSITRLATTRVGRHVWRDSVQRWHERGTGRRLLGRGEGEQQNNQLHRRRSTQGTIVSVPCTVKECRRIQRSRRWTWCSSATQSSRYFHVSVRIITKYVSSHYLCLLFLLFDLYAKIWFRDFA